MQRLVYRGTKIDDDGGKINQGKNSSVEGLCPVVERTHTTTSDQFQELFDQHKNWFNPANLTNSENLKCGFGSEKKVNGEYLNGRQASRTFCNVDYPMCCDTTEQWTPDNTDSNSYDTNKIKYNGVCMPESIQTLESACEETPSETQTNYLNLLDIKGRCKWTGQGYGDNASFSHERIYRCDLRRQKYDQRQLWNTLHQTYQRHAAYRQCSLATQKGENWTAQ